MTANPFRMFVDANVWLSRQFDRLFSVRISQRPYEAVLSPKYLVEPGMHIADVGGGKKPILDSEFIRQFGIRYSGLDIDAEELALAPAETYHQTHIIDLTKLPEDFRPNFDLVICKSTLEHVEDAEAALVALVQILKPGGMCYINVPCRKALFARLNRLLPNNLKRRVLHTVYPHKSSDGFEAHYDRATPPEYVQMLREHGIEPQYLVQHYWSSYFGALLPVYIIWRLASALQLLFDSGYCERFEIVFRKPISADDTIRASAILEE